MQTLKTLSTATALAALLTLAAAGMLNANARRAAYLEQETGFFECVDSGLDRSECAQGVGW